jgi:hypothetical protein
MENEGKEQPRKLKFFSIEATDGTSTLADYSPEIQKAMILQEIADELESRLPKELYNLLLDVDGAFKLAIELPNALDAVQAAGEYDRGQRTWELVGLLYLRQEKFHEAASIFGALYHHQNLAQRPTGSRYHKGMPLVYLHDCYLGMGYFLIARRYLMLTLVEDALIDEGRIDPAKGVYFRAVPTGLLPESDLNRYAKEAFAYSKSNAEISRFPEAVLQSLDQNWLTHAPSTLEAGTYIANREYIGHLFSKIGIASDGRVLEQLAEYLFSCVPGCRTQRRKRSMSTDYDLICSIEGPEIDFRSEFGRYFLCECKDWAQPADFGVMAKFCRVLDSVKARFGIIFSRNGISGAGRTKYAEREQLKAFQDRGMVIVVVDESDLKKMADGANLIGLLRTKYEKIRLDLYASDEL